MLISIGSIKRNGDANDLEKHFMQLLAVGF